MTGKIKRSLVLLGLMALCLTGALETVYQMTPFPAYERDAGSYLADVRERATYAYAVARSLNAVISLVESVDVGVGFVSAQPAQVLAPIDDMIEQFSDLILIALASVGIQEIMVAVLGDVSWTYLLPLALFPLLIAPFAGRWQDRLDRLGLILLVSVIATRLLIPALSVGGQVIVDHYLREDYQTAVEEVETVGQQTGEKLGRLPKISQPLPPEITTPGSSVFSKPAAARPEGLLVPEWDLIKKIGAEYDAMIALLSDLPNKIITLITIFAFETLALPLLGALLFVWLGRLVCSMVMGQRHSD